MFGYYRFVPSSMYWYSRFTAVVRNLILPTVHLDGIDIDGDLNFCFLGGFFWVLNVEEKSDSLE